MSSSDVYLKAMMSLVARQTFSPERLVEIVSSQRHTKTIITFNLCDGSRTQAEVAKQTGLDTGNLSRTIARWIDDGVMIKVNDGAADRPVHVYPVTCSPNCPRL